jgi:hypothetical protein
MLDLVAGSTILNWQQRNTQVTENNEQLEVPKATGTRGNKAAVSISRG